MRDSNKRIYLDALLSMNPSNIGLLTQLHTLQLSARPTVEHGPAAERDTNLEWVTELTSLQELSISFCRCDVLQHLLPLTKLTCLKVFGQPDWAHRLPIIDLEAEWHRLQALQEMCICQVILQLGKGFAGLLQVDCLRQISFAGSAFYNEKDARVFAALVHEFGGLRPQVKLIHDLRFETDDDGSEQHL